MVGCRDGRLWARETKIAKKLVEKYGHEFLLQCSLPYGKHVTSLCYFISQDGKDFLSDKLLEYQKTRISLSPTASVPLEAEKQGDDVHVAPTKPKTLKDFLKYGQEIGRQTSGTES